MEFSPNELCVCLYKDVGYAAKIMKQKVIRGKIHYLVHFVNWNKRFDELIPNDSPRLVKGTLEDYNKPLPASSSDQEFSDESTSDTENMEFTNMEYDDDVFEKRSNSDAPSNFTLNVFIPKELKTDAIRSSSSKLQRNIDFTSEKLINKFKIALTKELIKAKDNNDKPKLHKLASAKNYIVKIIHYLYSTMEWIDASVLFNVENLIKVIQLVPSIQNFRPLPKQLAQHYAVVGTEFVHFLHSKLRRFRRFNNRLSFPRQHAHRRREQ
ncbi:hypothetical protein CRE_07661 [Caenorhabditis remanei]|uniref:Tudor-knot domain-containing protein n=1 Tax=Caenorhabditis remanei TaxID=31234 RepID=E3MP60_CAERE|nr:hypothetical protein CRE_07661 [Caenorhabditis remanei]